MMKKVFITIFSLLLFSPAYANDFLYCDIVYRNANRPVYTREQKSKQVFKLDYENNKVYSNDKLLKSEFTPKEIKIINEYFLLDSVFRWTYIINRFTGNLTGSYYYNVNNREDISSITGTCNIKKRQF